MRRSLQIVDRRPSPPVLPSWVHPGQPNRSGGDSGRRAVVEVLLAHSTGGSGGVAGVGQGTVNGQRSLIQMRPGTAECLGFHHAGPAHPRDSRLRVITELLCYPFDAAPAAERANGRGDGLPDLSGAEFFGALQGRHEQGVGAGGADAEVVHRWPHCEPPRQADTSTTQPEYDNPPLMQSYCPLMRVDYNKLVRDRIPEIIGSRGDRAVTRVLDEAAYRDALLAKLVEEAQEASVARDEELPAELADVLEALHALAKTLGMSWEQLLALAADKRTRRGGFDGRLFLEYVEQAR
jgi:predicted house-cleaning noncanonical NTP pyrophosphatase (MazG superfamily)